MLFCTALRPSVRQKGVPTLTKCGTCFIAFPAARMLVSFMPNSPKQELRKSLKISCPWTSFLVPEAASGTRKEVQGREIFKLFLNSCFGEFEGLMSNFTT